MISFIKATYVDVFRFTRHPWEGVKSIYKVSLYRNASYLMANSGVTAILGVVFWIVAARFYSDADVGLGAALISAGMLLSFIGTLGLGFGIIRFLPESNDKSRLLNSSFTITIITSIVVALIFLAGLPLWSPKLMFVRENPAYFAAFIGFIVAGALNIILPQVFIGFRRSGFALSRGMIFSIVKLVLVGLFAGLLKKFGIFTSWGLAVMVSSIVCLFLFLPRVLPGFQPFLNKPNKLNKEMAHFSIANFFGQTLQDAPIWILPLMVLNLEGTETNAHFYIVWMIANLPVAISTMISLSLFAEGSSIDEHFGVNLIRSLKLTMYVLIPSAVIMFLVGDKLLLIFGKEYSEMGTHLLWLLAISAFPTSINFIYLGVARVEKKLKTIIIVTGILAFGILISSYLSILWIGILGVGVSWLITQFVVALVTAPQLVLRLNKV
ncbi:lipopolysaccharide biosynthesis protein [Chloroflexota bacterium]